MTDTAILKQQPAPIADGIYENMPFEQYAAVDAINGSSIVNMRRSPMYYRWAKDNPQPPTDALKLGIATHRLILEPNRVGDFAVWGEQKGENVRRGKVWDAFQIDHADKMIVTRAERDSMVGMSVGVRKSQLVRRYTDAKGPTEVSLFWHDYVSGRSMKCRLDKWIPKEGIDFDLKTCRSCNRYQFGGAAYKLGYHIKMAIQWSGIKALTGKEPKLRLGAIESKPPYETAVYRLTKDVILQGLEELDELVRTLTECEKSGTWPPALEEETDLILPTWAITEQDGDFETEEA